MSKKGLTVCGVALGAAVMVAASSAFAFTSDAGGEPHTRSAPETLGPSGYDFSGQNFELSVRKNNSDPGNAAAPPNGSAAPASGGPHQSRGFFERAWDGLMDFIGVGD